MTYDQKIQLWALVGTWFSGLATIFVAFVALHLARSLEKIRLKVNVGLRSLVSADRPATECLYIGVINLGERPVTIDSVGWHIGKRKNRRFAIQTLSPLSTHQYPKKIEHGEKAQFFIYFTESPNWMKDFVTQFVHDVSDKSIKTLRSQIHTSVGHSIDIVPEQSLLEKLKKVGSDGDG